MTKDRETFEKKGKMFRDGTVVFEDDSVTIVDDHTVKNGDRFTFLKIDEAGSHGPTLVTTEFINGNWKEVPTEKLTDDDEVSGDIAVRASKVGH